MVAKWDSKLSWPEELTYPAYIGMLVVLATVIILYIISNWNARKLALGGKGSRYVVDEDGSNVVRR